MDPSSRCCFGGCPTRGGTIAVSIFLICTAVINLICGWIAWAQNTSNYVTSLTTVLTIIFASLAIWGFQAKKWWPCVGMIVVLVFNILGCILVLALAGMALAASGDCIAHAQPQQCEAQRTAAIALLVIYLIAVFFCAWFIYVYAKAVDFIKAEQAVGLPVHFAGATNAGYVVSQPAQQPTYFTKE